MQCKKLLIFLVAGAILAPSYNVKAASRHYTAEELKSDIAFFSDDNHASLTAPSGKYSYLDAYFLTHNEILSKAFLADGPIYNYYLYSEEVKDSDEFLISLKTQNPGTFPYYWSEQSQSWLPAVIVSKSAGSWQFKLKGKTNKFFLNKQLPFSSKDLVYSLGNFTFSAPQALIDQPIATLIMAVDETPYPSLKTISSTYQFEISLPENDVNAFLEQKRKTNNCAPLLASHLTAGKSNSSSDVKKLQQFLRSDAGFGSVQITGKYDKITQSAVKSFQERYGEEILKPWGLSEGSGQIYKTTLAKINSLFCQNSLAKQTSLKISYNYGASNGKAKSLYYLDEATGKWLEMESVDNHKTATISATTKLTSLKIAVIEEPNAWVGEASWYAYKNGNFAASRDWSKGTKLKVTSQNSEAERNNSVIVTINDYGPEEWTGRIIDLDKAAFQKLGSLSGGVMPVKIEEVK